MSSKSVPSTVTAIVPVRNRRVMTLRCLDTLSRQTYPALNVVVVDANSTDGTTEAIRKAYPEVEVCPAGDGDYWAGATNIGVRHALAGGSEWLLTINDDSVIAPEHVERLLQLAIVNNCSILGSQINYLSAPARIWSLGAFNIWGGSELLRLAHHGEFTADLPSSVVGRAVLPVDALPGNGVLIHHSVFRRVGLYNALFLPHYHADSEFVMRAVACGIKAWVTPQVVLLNDFSPRQKKLPLRGFRGLLWSLGHPKSHLYLPSLLYIYLRYCPARLKVGSFAALAHRFLAMGPLSSRRGAALRSRR